MKTSIKRVLAIIAVSAMTFNLTSIVPNEPYSMVSVVAAETNTLTYVDSEKKLAYMFIPHSDGNTCTLFRVYDTVNPNNTSTLGNTKELSIPAYVQDSATKNLYKITELGANGESIFYNSNNCSQRVTSVILPHGIKIINNGAFFSSKMNALETLSINLDTLEHCGRTAFGDYTAINEVKVYNSSTRKYISTSDSVDNFNNVFGIINKTKFVRYPELDQYISTSSEINGKLEFLNAINCSPYSKKVSYTFAKKIVADNNINSSANTKQQKYEMIYNYLIANSKYSKLYTYNADTSKAVIMDGLCGTALSNLAFHSGVCGSFAHAFEMLCKAAGINSTYAACMGVPGHAANVVKINSSDDYYKIDCVDNKFMTGNSELVTYYVYGTDTTRAECSATEKTISLSNDDFYEGFSYIVIDDKTTDNKFNVTLTDANNSSKKYIDYTTRGAYSISNGVYLNELVKDKPQTTSSFYIDSNTYYNLTIKLGSTQVLKLQNVFHGNKNNYFTVGNKKYNCIVETLDYSSAVCNPHSSYSNYFKVTIKPA